MNIQVLVVDNNPVHLKAVSAFIVNEGCSVITATNGLEALELLQKIRPEIIVTDLVMPMIGGEQLCKIIKGVEEYKKIFLVVLSAILLEDKERLVSEIACDLFIAKGTLSEIRDHLKKALQTYRRQTEALPRILGDGLSAPSFASPSVAKELIIEKDHLLRIIDNLAEGIIELSSNGRILSMNHAAETILSTKRESLIAKKFDALPWGRHTSQIRSWCESVLEMQGTEILEIRDDDPLDVNNRILTLSCLPLQDNGVHFTICIIRDITRQYHAEKEKKEMDNALKLIKKMEAMSCMAGGVAHDLNNLLTVICGNLDMISTKGDTDSNGRNQKALHNARHAAYSTVELVRKISVSSPFGIIQRDKVQLEEFVTDLAEKFFYQCEETDFSFHCFHQNLFVNIDKNQMRLALENIFQNACESGTKSMVKIAVDREVIGSATIRSGQYISVGHYAKIKIEDHGRGISREDLHEIFDPYFSTKERGALKGMGLGLTIVYSTLRNHGGCVIVESEKNHGTSVSLYIPYIRENTRDAIFSKDINILVVESDPALRNICKMMLEYLNCSAAEVASSKEALQLVKKKKKDGGPFALAIVNLNSDGKRDGIEVCSRLHAIDAQMKVIITSGSIWDPVMIGFKEYGFTAALAKPYTMDDLRKVLASVQL